MLKNTYKFWSSLSFKQARTAVVVALVLGIGFSMLQIAADFQKVESGVDESFGQALNAVEETAFQAAFSLDKILAQTVVHGLFQRAGIIEARIDDNFGASMAIENRPQKVGAFKWLAAQLFDDTKTYTIKLRSKKTNFYAGDLSITVDMYVIAGNFFQRSGLILLSGMLRNFLLAIILTLLFYQMLSKPLHKVASLINDGRSKIQIPLNHEDDELGDIVKAHNKLSRQHNETTARLKEEESHYRRLFENSEISIWHEDLSEVYIALEALRQDGVHDLRRYLEDNEQCAWDLAAMVKVIQVNEATIIMFDAKDEEEFLFQIDKTFGPSGIEVFIDELCAIWDRKTVFRAEVEFRTLSGKQLLAILSMQIPKAEENYRSIPVSILDITERTKVEQALLTQSQITSNMGEGALLTRTSDGTIVYTNQSFERMFGYGPGEMLGKHVSILNAPTDVSPEEIFERISRETKTHGQWHGEVCNIKKDGSVFWCSVNISTFNHSEYGEVLLSINSDSTERRQAEEQLNYQAKHDNLTGLINRREFEFRAERLISATARDKGEHAMCFMDLDQFKIVNDTCGHTAGDELLRQLGQVLQNSVRRRDTLARLGGDEFGVLMEHCSLEQAQRATVALLEKVDDFQFSWERQPFHVSVSIGLVAITESTGNFTELLKQADAACYMAKDQGRNRIHVYHPEDTELAQRHGEMQWVARINQALEDNRFTLYGQSIVPLDKSIDRHYELLLRMIDEDGKIIPPGSFLPAAERYDLIVKIDTWVIGEAFDLMTSHPAFVEQIGFVSINLSGRSLANVNFLDTVIAQIKEHQIDAKKICFEITETAAISNLNAATIFISTLKELGCCFALDDFGSGLSSFGYLKNLPVDYLKIDGMFVKDIIDDPIDHAMVKSINEIGHVMGMKTIAEFVENDAIKEMLIEIGVDYAQGYGIGKPKPFSEILKLLN